MEKEKVRVDLACGARKKEGCIGVDVVDIEGVDIVHDLTNYPWPFEDNSVDEVYSHHYIEHIPHDIHNEKDKRDGLIQFVDEIYRILKPGGKAVLVAPYYTSMRAFQDPTHERFICDGTFYYFNKEWREGDTQKLGHYNIKSDFDMVFSYYITNEMTLKSEEVRKKAFSNDWNVIEDIQADLTKRNN
jgi:predicted SAM-dependent methyltransferase